MIGHACDECGASMADCDAHIRETGTGCCVLCFVHDTHGLLDKFKVIDVADHAQEIQNLTRLSAQAVIAISEHAKVSRRLMADVDRLTQENALLRGRVNELERREEMVDERTKRNLVTAALTEVRTLVRDLPERVREVEDCVVGIEQKLKIKRRPKAERMKALPPGT